MGAARLPIITMVMPQEREPALQAGCDDYLLCPVYEALPDKVAGYLDLKVGGNLMGQ